jgi:hypothetical protein
MPKKIAIALLSLLCCFCAMADEPANPDQEWKVYWSIRLTGPNFPFGKVWERDAILIDRMILVKCVPGETLPNTLTAAKPK